MGPQLKRRLVTIPAVIAGFVLSTLLLPVLVLLALAGDLLTGLSDERGKILPMR